MEYKIKIYLPNDDNIINALVVNATSGEVKYVSIVDALKIKDGLTYRKNVKLETIFIGVGETQDVNFEEDLTYTYKVEVIPKRKEITTPPEFKNEPFLYEIVIDSTFKVKYMEHETEKDNNQNSKEQEPIAEIILEK